MLNIVPSSASYPRKLRGLRLIQVAGFAKSADFVGVDGDASFIGTAAD